MLPKNRHFCHFGGWGCWGVGGPLFLGTRHFCHFWCCWGLSEPVTFVILVLLGAAGELGGPLFLRTRHFCHFWCCWGLLGSWGAICFSEPVTFVTFGGCWGLLGSWGPFVSQNPSLLSLLGVLAGQNPSLLSLLVLLGAAGELGALCFSEPVTFVTFGAGGAAGELGPCFSEPVTFVTSGCCQLGLVADRASLHAPEGEVTKVTTRWNRGVAGKCKPAIDGRDKLLVVGATSPQAWRVAKLICF